MYISACLAYDDLNLDVSHLEDAITIRLENESRVELSFSLHPMQCKVLGEALLNAVATMRVNHKSGYLAGSMEVNTHIHYDKEEEVCQQPNLFAPTGNVSLSKTA